MNIVELFPKRKKVKGWDEYGRRTAYWIKQSGSWDQMMSDIYHCATRYELSKCRWFWAAKVEQDLWNQYWITDAAAEFDMADEALAAQQAE